MATYLISPKKTTAISNDHGLLEEIFPIYRDDIFFRAATMTARRTKEKTVYFQGFFVMFGEVAFALATAGNEAGAQIPHIGDTFHMYSLQGGSDRDHRFDNAPGSRR